MEVFMEVLKPFVEVATPKLDVEHVYGENTLNPPQIVITSIIFMQLKFLVTYGHHILDYFYFLKVYLLSFKIILINHFEIFNKI
jgi:hypothetical protein